LKAGVYPASFAEDISSKAPNFYKWAQQVAKHPSVIDIYDEDVVVGFSKRRIAENRG
jgi:glutathione S-transferase